ncbi:MAG: hypothetical protein WDZ29_03290 [Balneolaceae bacterium]
MLNNKITLGLFTILLTSCVTTSNIPTEISSGIPDDANVINLYSTESPSDFYTTIYRHLASRGFGFTQENPEMGTLTTDFIPIDKGYSLQINIFIDEIENESVASLRGKWGFTRTRGAIASTLTGGNFEGSAEFIRWGGDSNMKYIFGEMAVIANKIEHQRLEYISD